MTHLENTPASPSEPKRPLAPDLSQLDDRSARAWTEPMAVEARGGGVYAVASASDNEYRADLLTGSCTCPDSGFRGARCKHLRRVALEVTRGDVPPPGRLSGTCAACSRESFLPEVGPRLCDDCRYEPGTAVRDRETGDILVVACVTDTPASEYATDEGRVVADYETNVGYPVDDPVVEAVYPFSAPASVDRADLPRYGFPHARLEPTGAQFVE
ncbi:SWIM zinc finger family protein [Halosegnis sp.]|uniref:SWIM zinc finger family protein n=1 Tax=Halosegnis sp. TaxID=2864959 RepID=UPI0035D4283F